MLAASGAHSSHCGYLWKNAFNTFLHNVIIIIHLNPLFQSELPRQSAAVWGYTLVCVCVCVCVCSSDPCNGEETMAGKVENTRKRQLVYVCGIGGVRSPRLTQL